MKTIYKYSLELVEFQKVELPENAEILSIQLQRGWICLWALVDTLANKVERSFEIYGTGQEIEKSNGNRKYLTTFQTESGLVFHVFEYGI